jgi:hypothetical protein
MNDLDNSLQVLVGEKLSSVTFVLDYWQLDFDGSGFNVMSKITVKGPDWAVSSGEAGFRDRLCGQIAKIVLHAEFKEKDGVFIAFEDKTSVFLSTQDEDYQGPEALLFRRRDSKNLWVV